MGRVIWIVIGGLLAALIGSVIWQGREATVWGAANAMPAPTRTLTASVLRGATGPFAFIEDNFGTRFGAVATADDLAGCAASEACVREKERHLPESALRGFRGNMLIETNGTCRFDGSLPADGFLPTQLGLEFAVAEGEGNAFVTANVAGVLASASAARGLPYLVDAAGCEFAKANKGRFAWKLLWAKGFETDKEPSAP